MILDHVILPLE